MMLCSIVSLILFSSFTIHAFAAIGCRDELNVPVDSWQAFKYNKGTTYVYSDTYQSPAVSPINLNDTARGALAYTTRQLWSTDLTSYILYNDEPPTANGGEPELTPGHTKGYAAVASDGSAFLVIHSIPKFPTGPANASDYVGMESNAWMYGQSALCLSLNISTLAPILIQMQRNAPQVYDWKSVGNSPADAAIAALGSGVTNSAATCEATMYETQGGTTFTYFAKSKPWNNDLYSACVSQHFQQSLLVESWIRGSAIGPSCDSPNPVLDVQDLNYDGYNLSEYNDHSKWAVSTQGSIVCIGDINRMTTQFGRGGGTACMESDPLAVFLRSSIIQTNSCSP